MASSSAAARGIAVETAIASKAIIVVSSTSATVTTRYAGDIGPVRGVAAGSREGSVTP